MEDKVTQSTGGGEFRVEMDGVGGSKPSTRSIAIVRDEEEEPQTRGQKLADLCHSGTEKVSGSFYSSPQTSANFISHLKNRNHSQSTKAPMNWLQAKR